MPIEDQFSKQAPTYARFRPHYPAELFAALAALTAAHSRAWDCATGNGQAAHGLLPYFAQILATDVSRDQLQHARPHAQIHYWVGQAEHMALPAQTLSLVTVAEAIHWFELDAFYAEVRRVLTPGGVLAAWGYHQAEITPELDRVLERFYREVLGPYWSPQMQLLDDGYQTLPFPFDELAAPQAVMEAEWTLADLLGFLESWSAVQKYVAAEARHPIAAIEADLTGLWGKPDRTRPVRWPLFFRIGRLEA